MEIKTIGIIGARRMGSGTAQELAATRFDLIIMNRKDEIIQKGVENKKKGLAKALEKGKITPKEKEKIRARIRTTTELEDMAKVDFIIEAVPEIAELKLDIFN